ncbi:MAG TPA: DNA gyrase subunit A [Candidatus Manganitrophaceae bacterium]|nr:DNA gyrase subunit A [Candidatus Manganitrophaceae bacterium]
MPVEEGRTTVNLETEMKSAYMDYAMSVIVGRALPDVRDGLKPVHRRILYAMFREGLLSNRRYSKSAGVVGEVIKKYHPHGDAAVYDAMVRMAQDFNMRYLLVDGQGNFGSVDGDPAAAYRYTEARLTKIAEEMLADIDMETVDFTPNFDEQVLEPVVLPTRTPNLLMNGSAGIAVGMATNIPPHNLGELIDGLVRLLNDPALSIEALMQSIKGPDFPTAGFIYGMKGIQDAYTTGRGSLSLRARAVIEVNERTEKETIVVTELPYQVNKARLIEKIAELIRDRKIEGIADLRDESDRDGMRIVVELKRGEIASIVLNQLYKHTQMQSSFGVIMLALVNNQPQVLNLKQMLQHFLDFRREVIIRRTRYELRQAEARAHILEGLKIALDHLDEVIALIRRSPSPEEAKSGLMAQFNLSEIQSQAILDMKLQRLTGLEREKLIAEYREVLQKIEALKALLASDALIRKAIQDELAEIKEKYADERRTEIIPETGEIHIEDLIAPEEMVITVSHTGYIKRNPASLYRSQRRGGKGKIGTGLKEEDFVEHLFVASTHDYLLFFTDAGRVYWLKVHQIPEAGRSAKGKAIVNLLQVAQTEKITAILSVDQFQEGRFVVMATRKGLVKKTALSAYSNPRAGGIRSINLEEGDRLIAARLTSGNHEILLGTKMGLSIRFPEDEARAVGRVATGVWGIRLREGDEVISMETLAANSQATILTITEKGYGKRTELSEYRTQGRGGQGIITIQTSQRNGCVVAAFQVEAEDEVMIVTTNGKIIRLRAKDIRVIGRNTQGVRLIDVEEAGRVIGVARLAEKSEREEHDGAVPLSEVGPSEEAEDDAGADE